ncbi:hypothetical protein RJ639_003332, partial [Escallonia herrerae]
LSPRTDEARLHNFTHCCNGPELLSPSTNHGWPKICCNKCGCVPSGTYGNKSECGWNKDMLNSKGKSKCP